MIKVFCLGILGVALAGCSSQAIIDNLATAKTNVSNFDGSKEIYSQPMYVFATSGFHAAPISIGARWTDKVKEYVVIEVEMRGDYANLSSLYLNFDGSIKEYKALQTATQFSAPSRQTLAPKLSKRSFMMSIADLEKIKTAQNIKIKVTTLSDGYLEGVVSKDGRLSPGAKSLINVHDQIVK